MWLRTLRGEIHISLHKRKAKGDLTSERHDRRCCDHKGGDHSDVATG